MENFFFFFFVSSRSSREAAACAPVISSEHARCLVSVVYDAVLANDIVVQMCEVHVLVVVLGVNWNFVIEL